MRRELCLRLTPDYDLDRLAQEFEWFKRFLDDPVDLAWFANLFPAGRADTYCADFSVFSALLGDEDFRELRASVERVRVLYVLRDPLKRYWSHVKHHLAIAEPNCDPRALSTQNFAELLRGPDFFPHGCYSAFIETARRHLTKNELLVIRFEELHADPTAGLARIEDFLGIAHHAYDPEQLAKKIYTTRRLGIPKSFRTACQPLIAEELDRLDQLGVDCAQGFRSETASRRKGRR